MSSYDILPDIHGQKAKLDAALANLGWRQRGLGWHHPDPGRHIVFLGDFIDRGPDNRAVLTTVRSLIDAGRARAIMGNHELNALHFHTRDPQDGQPLRPHTAKNIRQHQSFLTEFPPGERQTLAALDWMRGLPLYLDMGDFRAVHACWAADGIRRLESLTGNGILSEDQLIRAAGRAAGDEMFHLAEVITKGPEEPLPAGRGFTDKDGTMRHAVRVRWWNAVARTWRDIAISVPSPDDLPDEDLPATLAAQTYPASDPPVFFGHYWLSGTPVLQAANALCLDYSAGKDGPLVSYHLSSAGEPLSLDNLRTHDARG